MALPVVPAADWHVRGLISTASNVTLQVEFADQVFVYKPIAGERPLWDFPDGSLARREIAASVVSGLLGWAIVPETALGEGPYGPGMVQRWVEWEDHPVALLPDATVPTGWLSVARGRDDAGRVVILAHEDSDDLRRVALFDVIVNNADRKGGHLLRVADGIRGIDHGVCFHREAKLRTVVWGFADQPVPDGLLADLRTLQERLARDADLLADQLTPGERAALARRLTALLDSERFPAPEGRGPTFPWPPM
jgi:uncharacterized repeat protein (TIGR03843 family)